MMTGDAGRRRFVVERVFCGSLRKEDFDGGGNSSNLAAHCLCDGVRLDVLTEAAIFTAKDAADPEMVKSRLSQLFPELEVQPRNTFKLAIDYVDDVIRRQKCTTIRYARNTVEYPTLNNLPIYQVCHERPGSPLFAGMVTVVGLCYKTFGCLDDTDAAKDGFGSVEILKSKLCEIYGEIQDAELLTIYAISPSGGMVSPPCK